MRIFCYVSTQKEKTEFVGEKDLNGNIWQMINLKARPIGNAANVELLKFIAKRTKSKATDWKIIIGNTSKYKILENEAL